MAYAKISVPRFHGILPRPRLFQLLDDMSEATAIWVSGPPGAGKTSLVGSYLETYGNSVLWYHVDHSDSDLSSFFSYFGEALAQKCRQGQGSFPKLISEQAHNSPFFYAAYFRQVFEALPAPCAIVLDDYHQAASNTLDHFLKAAIMEAPSSVRLFITSRTPPPSFLARERANRRLAIVDWDQLKFDAEEISRLCDVAGVQGDGSLVVNLSQKTLGWAAGLVLLLERTRMGDPVDWTLSPGHSPETIFNYFAEEIFELEDRRSQKVLPSLAFLPRYTQKMALAISGDPDAGKIVDDLSSKNFFTDRRSGPIETYQFHALFREFLARKASVVYSVSDLRQLKIASAQLMEQNKDFDTAVDLYHELEEFAEVERIVLSQADGLWSLGQSETVSRWIRRLPYAWVEARPMLLYWSAKTEFFSNPPHARQLLEQAYPGFAATGQISHQVMTASEILRCYSNERKNFQGIGRWIACLEKLLHEHGGELPAPLRAGAWCGLLFGMAVRQPHRLILKDCADQLSALMHHELEPNLKLSMAAGLLEHYAWRGQFPVCEEVLAHARTLVELPEVAAISRVVFGIAKLRYFSCVAEYPAAKAEFGALTQVAQKDKHFFLRPMIYLHYAQACLSSGRLQEVDSLIAEVDRLIDPRRSIDLMDLHLVRSWLALLHGDATLAKKEAQRMLALHIESAATKTYGHGLLAFATASAMAGEFDAVADTVNEARRLLLGMDSPLVEFHILLTEAYVHLQSGRHAACRLLLAAGLLLAKREGLSNSLQWAPNLVAPLCVEALEAGIEADYVGRLIRARGLNPPAGCYMSSWPWPIEIRALGSFEIRIAGEPLHFTHKAQKKPLEFLKLLIAQGGKNVNAERAADTLWPDAEGDAAQSSFDSTLYRLRKLLRHDDVITLSEGKLSLNPSLCWLDTWALERLLQDVMASPSAERCSYQAAELFHIYRGPFFSAVPDFAVPNQASANHRSKFERCLVDLCRVFLAMEKTEQAVALLEQGLERDAEAKMLAALLKSLRGPAG